jgi:hypothetical protein
VSGIWSRLGRLPLDTAGASWAVSHAALPLADLVEPGAWHVYLSPRDREGRARIGRTRLTLEPTPRLAPLESDPVLDLGALGAFDDSGVTVSSLVTDGGRKLLYYTGWTRGVTVPFYLFAGLAVSEDGGRTFQRASLAPLLDRTADDPYLTASPFVLIEDGHWRMWYVSGSSWEHAAGGPRHRYHIRYADSEDGMRWERRRGAVIDYATPEEHAFSRPFVTHDADGYRMWYAYRGHRYRIGCARSRDGLTWTRCGDGGLDPSGEGWDSESVAYPWILDANGRRYMLYNGNDYGRTGIGLAVCEP